MNQFICISLFFLPLWTLGQDTVSNHYETKYEYYENGDVKMKYKTFKDQKVDTLIVFDAKGRKQAVLYYGEFGSPNPIYREEFYYKGASRKSTGYYIVKEGADSVNVGNWKYFWKNGSVMDSVIYDNSGIKKYRARFSKRKNKSKG